MGRSQQEMAADRAQLYDAQIREALAGGNDRLALKLAVDFLLSETKKRSDRTPGDGALINVDAAGLLVSIAATLYDHRPDRPRGCPRVPGPEHLVAVYQAALDRATEEGPS